MAGSMKDIKLRIKSVESTMQITKAMELVASSKMRLDEAVGIGCEHALKLLLSVLIQIAGGADGLHDGGTRSIVVQIFVQSLLILGHVRHLDLHKVIVNGRIQDGHLLFYRHASASWKCSSRTAPLPCL